MTTKQCSHYECPFGMAVVDAVLANAPRGLVAAIGKPLSLL
jgi:hypothetical protein